MYNIPCIYLCYKTTDKPVPLKNKNPLDSSLPDFVGSDSNACKLSIPTF